MNRGKYIPLTECIADYQILSEQGNTSSLKLWTIAYQAMDEMGMDYFYEKATAQLPVMSNKTARLPATCLQWIKAGVLNNKGELIPMAYNSKLSGYVKYHRDRIAKVEDPGVVSALGRWGGYWNGTRVINLKGDIHLRNFGSFKVDGDTVILDPQYPLSYVMVECLMAPKVNQEYLVPLVFKPAIIAYLAWKDIQHLPSSRRGALGDKRDRRHEYYNERRLARERWMPFRPWQEYPDAYVNVDGALSALGTGAPITISTLGGQNDTIGANVGGSGGINVLGILDDANAYLVGLDDGSPVQVNP